MIGVDRAVKAGDGGGRFLVARQPRPAVEWDPPEPTADTGYDVRYFGEILASVGRQLGRPDLTFVLTWDVEALSETGRHVVAIVQGDEDARIPRWAGQVLATFKCYGARPFRMPIGTRPGITDALELAHYLRRLLLWLPGALTVGAPAKLARRRLSIFPLPLGYYNQEARPMLAPRDRRWLISFAGSGVVEERARVGAGQPLAALRRALGTPKQRSRARMSAALAGLERQLPPGSVAMVTLEDFPSLLPGHDGDARSLTASYSDLLAGSCISLVPRGNSAETFRFFEALRAGCIVICEPLPDHWFYRGAPVITVRDWSELPAVVLPLVRDQVRLEELHLATLDWWRTRCSEDAVAAYVHERVVAELAVSDIGTRMAPR